jgi:hypothetical protein
MPYFDRWDICIAWFLIACDWGLYDVITRLNHDIGFHAGGVITHDQLSENGQAIYDCLNARLEARDPEMLKNSRFAPR